MPDIRPTYDDEIDLFDLFETLWDGKWLIGSFVAIAVLFGSVFLFFKDAEYESKLGYYVENAPPFSENNHILADFERKFYSASVFDDWKKISGNSTLAFSDIAATEVVDGFVLLVDEDEQLGTLVSEKNGDSFVLVKSKQLPLLDDFFKYANHIIEIMNNEYIVRSSDERRIMRSIFKDFSSPDGSVLQYSLMLERFVGSIKAGSNVLTIRRPTKPQKVAPKPPLILSICTASGGVLGVFFILLRKAITRRKEQLAKS